MIKSKIKKCLNSFFISYQISNDCEILDLTSNLQNATPQSAVFYKFHNFDESEKNLFTKRLSQQPGLIIVNRDLNGFYAGDFIVVNDSEFIKAQHVLADLYYPISNIKIYGITGTNGKTSVAFLSMQVSRVIGIDALYIGTLGLWKNGECLIDEINNTTPSLIDFHKMVYQNKSEAMNVFVEVSSHALEQKRLEVKFEKVAWTNFTQDHLDYHKTMDSYFLAKLKIVEYLKKQKKEIIVPKTEKDLVQKIKMNSSSLSVLSPCELSKYAVNYPSLFSAGFNKSNLEVALALNFGNSAPSKKIDLSQIEAPPGRFMQFTISDNIIIVDYAHTPDALRNIILEVKSLYPEKKVITIFGCGGDRDKSKRPLMGDVVLELSDVSLVTSDNPRSENPMDIINDVVANRDGFLVNENRKEAILSQLKIAKNSVIIIAGKGHEPYQEIKGIKYKYSDIETVKSEIHEI